MSELNQRPLTTSTACLSPSTPNPNRNHQRINVISDFFRARFPTRPDVPERVPPATVPPPIQPPLPPSRHQLIPIQVLLDHPIAWPSHADNTREDDASAPRTPLVPPVDPQANLHRAQRLWAAMFRTSAQDIVAAHRPIILSVENQRANELWGDRLARKTIHSHQDLWDEREWPKIGSKGRSTGRVMQGYQMKFKRMFSVARSIIWIPTTLKYDKFYTTRHAINGNVHVSLLAPLQLHSRTITSQEGRL